jgi:hypothetical protein
MVGRRLAVVGLVAALAGAGEARVDSWVADQRARQVAESATAVVETTLRWCRDNRAALRAPASAVAPSDSAWLRRACGLTLDGRPWPSRDPWRFAFIDAPSPDGRLEVFGLRRDIDAPGGPWQVVVGVMWRIHQPHEAPERVSRTPVADLMHGREGTWHRVWRYVSEDGGGAILPEGEIEDPAAPPGAGDTVRAIWHQVIASEFRVWAREFLDARGVMYRSDGR